MKNKRTIFFLILLLSFIQLQLGMDMIRLHSIRRIEQVIGHLRLNQEFNYKTVIKDSPTLASDIELNQDVNS